MATAYYPTPTANVATATKTVAAPSVWKRLYDRFLEARAAQAQREITRHAHMAHFNPASPALVQIWHHPIGD